MFGGMNLVMTMKKTQFTLIGTIFISLLLISGCIETGIDSSMPDISQIEVPDIMPNIVIPEQINDAAKVVKNYFDIGITAITSNVSDAAVALDERINMTLVELNKFIESIPQDCKEIMPEDTGIVESIAGLKKIDNNSLSEVEGYVGFTDNVAFILELINVEGGLGNEVIKGTLDEQKELSMFITRWVPIVDNYNNLIDAARSYDENDPESVNAYYVAFGLLCLEVGLIYTHVWYKSSYMVVGKIYRVSGLNRLAFKCPTLISTILSQAHWGLRNYLTNKTTEAASIIILGIPENVTSDIANKICN